MWILQILLGVYFLVTGVLHFIVPPGLPSQMAWMYELPPALHYFSGAAEIMASLGLILPGLTRIQTRLTPLAALGLVFVMAGAIVWHATRSGESTNVVMNAVLMGLSAIVAYGRWKLSPLKGKAAAYQV
ncbi:MAG: DoxX family protein [Chloroflexota bacterium]